MSTAISILVKGPGWYPGTPRLGDSGDIPEVSGRALWVWSSISLNN